MSINNHRSRNITTEQATEVSKILDICLKKFDEDESAFDQLIHLELPIVEYRVREILENDPFIQKFPLSPSQKYYRRAAWSLIYDAILDLKPTHLKFSASIQAALEQLPDSDWPVDKVMIPKDCYAYIILGYAYVWNDTSKTTQNVANMLGCQLRTLFNYRKKAIKKVTNTILDWNEQIVDKMTLNRMIHPDVSIVTELPDLHLIPLP